MGRFLRIVTGLALLLLLATEGAAIGSSADGPAPAIQLPHMGSSLPLAEATDRAFSALTGEDGRLDPEAVSTFVDDIGSDTPLLVSLTRDVADRVRTEIVREADRRDDRTASLAWVRIGERLATALTRFPERSADPFAMRLPADAKTIRPIRFPEDEGAHSDKLVEWWYFNGHANAGTGRDAVRYGFEMCFFKVNHLLFFTHLALSDLSGRKFRFERKFYRAKDTHFGTGGADTRMGANTVRQTGPDSYHLSARFSAPAAESRGRSGSEAPRDAVTLELDLVSQKKPLLVGGDGVIDMPEGTWSYYYSKTRCALQGKIGVNGREQTVDGISWFDHQWGNFVVVAIGWDWFALQLPDGRDYNVFGFRKDNGALTNERLVTISNADGSAQTVRDLAIATHGSWLSPHTGHRYPMDRTISIPSLGESLRVTQLLPDQELYLRGVDYKTYWEGAGTVARTGGRSARDPEAAGHSYTEMVGYTKSVLSPEHGTSGAARNRVRR